MAISRSCPGAQLLKEARPEFITCPHCQNEVEVWSDEFRARCGVCHAWVYRQQGATCLDWCAQAERCVGASTLARYRQTRKGGT
jgi:hypothetical protein